jgi:nucleoside-diphosphate-sugar epimerase
MLGSLQVDIGKTRDLLGWFPPFGFATAIQETADDFMARKKLGH